MKLTIEVKDPKEAEAIKRALADPDTRALVASVGELLTLPDVDGATMVLDNLNEALEEFKNAANVRGEKV